MGQPQFFHIETYARSTSQLSNRGTKRSVKQIVNEALRIDGYCGHIEAPQPAQLIFGQTVENLVQRLEDLLSQAHNYVNHNDGREFKRKIRRDAHVLLAAVYSYPIEKKDVVPSEMDRFFMDCITFTQERFGNVDSALMHSDENYYHIHVYVLSANAKALHPGHTANENRRKDKSLKVTYRQAMSTLQEEFYQKVSVNHDMTRFGPRRERVSRQLYLAAKKDSDAEMEFYHAELDRAIKAHEADKLKKLKEAEKFYENTLELWEGARHILDKIELLETYLANLETAEKAIHELQIQLALKDAVIAEYQQKYDDDQRSALMS